MAVRCDRSIINGYVASSIILFSVAASQLQRSDRIISHGNNADGLIAPHRFGFSTPISQLLTVPPYVFASTYFRF